MAVTRAPVDQYFGKLKMSALRVRYETMQLRKRYESHELLPDQTLHLLLFAQDAFEEWARLYPRDPWLASTAYNLAQLYEELPGSLPRERAVALLVYVKSQFPNTVYARRSRTQLHRGVPTKPEPAWASSRAPVATPSPATTRAPSAATASASPIPYRPVRRSAAR